MERIVGTYAGPMPAPPPLSPRLTHVRAVVVVGTVLWLAAAAVLVIAAVLGLRPLDIWFTTCLAGALLGGVGYAIFAWQRAAARRGSRTAQDGLE
jgi:Protein of unknown function (DUF2530)